MTLADAFCKDLSPIAGAIHKEALLCADLCNEQGATWDPEAERLVANTYSSGISQVLHMMRLLQLEAIAMEQASALNPA